MIQNYYKLFFFLNKELFLLSIVLFLLGVALSIFIVKLNIKCLLRYPLWIWNKLKIFLKKQPTFFQLFFLIFFFNCFSLIFNIISGFGIVLPYAFAVLTGINVGIIGYTEGGSKAIFSMFLSPHAIFELPAVWLSTTLGMLLGNKIIFTGTEIGEYFLQTLFFYVYFIIPLLFFAALIETSMIWYTIKLKSKL